MNKRRLVELCDVIVPMRDKPKEFATEKNGIPWCRIEDIEGKFLNGSKSEKYVSKECIERMNLKVFPVGTVLCAVTGASIGTYGITTRELITNQTFAGLVCKENLLYNEFLYYYLKMHTSTFINNSVGCAQAYITRETLENFLIPDLEYDEQVRLVKVLKHLDDKIKINNESNVELELMTRTIYDYWFLQFDFPDENGKPYKSSGGKMVWNEEVKRKIPEGWSVGNLYDIADFINGLACQKYRPLLEHKKIPVVKIAEMHDGITETTEYVRDDIPEKYIINDGDILFSWSATLETILWTGGKAGLNQHIFKVLPKVDAKYYVYMQLSTYLINFVKMAEARKTTMGHITAEHIKQSRIVLPPQNIALKYSNLTEEIFAKLISNNRESRELVSLRNFLLPLLMNGQVGFKEC